MILTAALGVSITVAITAYAASRDQSPGAWGGASLLITGVSMLVSLVLVDDIGTSDMVFARQGTAVAMLVSLAGPIVAILGNLALASRLASVPMVRRISGSSWRMWRLGARGKEGSECQLSARPDAIVGMLGADELFSIARAELAAVEVDGESLVLRATDGRQIRLLLMDGDPDDRSARIAEINAVQKALTRSTTSSV